LRRDQQLPVVKENETFYLLEMRLLRADAVVRNADDFSRLIHKRGLDASSSGRTSLIDGCNDRALS
jgi:hypothetical protein